MVVGIREGTLQGGLPYLAFGSGPPLVALPGLTPTHTLPTGMTRRMTVRPLTPLAGHFTVYAVNRKPGLRPGTTMADIAGHYAAAISREFGEPVRVHGVSTGGSVAQQLAVDHPHLVRRLVLVATACRLSPHGRRVQRQLAELTVAGRPRRAWAGVGATLAATAAGGWAMGALMWLFGGRMAPDDPSDMIATIEAEDAFDACPRLSRITAPTLLVAGERDRFYTPELFRATVAGIPGARLCLCRGVGHAGTVGDKAAVREILAFLTAEA